MPLISNDDFQNRMIPTTAQDLADNARQTPDVDVPEFSETLGAAFSQFNTVANVIEGFSREGTSDEFDPNFDSLADENVEGYEDFADRFIDVGNAEDQQIIKDRIDREGEQREILANSPTWATVTSGLLAGVLDPLVMIPAAKIAVTASRGAKIAQGLSSGARFGATAGVAREAVLGGTQELRTGGEATIDILAETALGGILGGAIGGLSRGARSAATIEIAEALKGADVKVAVENGVPNVQTGSVGAASSREAKLEAEGLAHINDNLAKAISGFGIEGLQSPIIRGVTSPFANVKEFTNNIFLHNLILKKNVAGLARGDVAENFIRQSEAQLAKAQFAVDKLYREATGLKGAARIKTFSATNKAKYKDFQLRVSRVLRDETLEDSKPVKAAAKLLRGEMDKVTKELQEAGILGKDIQPTTARNYLMRAYDTAKMADRGVRDSFITRVSAHFQKFTQEGTLRVNPLDDGVAELRALESYDNIMGQGDRAMEMNAFADSVRSTGKFTKSRELNIPDTVLEPYLVNDAAQLTTNFVRRGAAIAQTQKALQRMGHENMGDLKKAMKSEHDEMLSGMDDVLARQKANDKFQSSLKLVDDMYDLITGTLRKPAKSDRYFDALLSFQFTRLLGGSAWSQMPELAMAPFRMGLGRTLADGYMPMIRSLKESNLSANQLKDLDIGLELEMNSILRVLGGTDDQYGSLANEWTRASGVVTDKFGKASGLTYVTYFNRRLAGQVALGSSIRDIKKFAATGKISQKKIETMAAGGIDHANLGRINKQLEKFAEERSGSHLANLHLWDDEVAKKQFSQFLQTEVESIILKPGKGDLPLVAQRSNLGKVIFQFKSFSATAANRIAISGIQRRDARVLTGLMMLVALGSASGAIKDLIAGRDPESDVDQLLLDGVSRSGVMGLMATVVLDTATMGTRDKTRRYVGRFGQGQLLGPSLSMSQDVFDLMGRLTDGKVSQGDVKAGVRLMPFMNLFYIQSLMNQVYGDK